MTVGICGCFQIPIPPRIGDPDDGERIQKGDRGARHQGAIRGKGERTSSHTIPGGYRIEGQGVNGDRVCPGRERR